MWSAAENFALSRRALLASGAGALFYGFHMPFARAESVLAPNAFIRVGGDGKISLVMPQVEMGRASIPPSP